MTRFDMSCKDIVHLNSSRHIKKWLKPLKTSSLPQFHVSLLKQSYELKTLSLSLVLISKHLSNGEGGHELVTSEADPSFAVANVCN